MVERNLAKVDVAGSNPVSRSILLRRAAFGLLRQTIFMFDFEGPIATKFKAKALERSRIVHGYEGIVLAKLKRENI